LTIHIEKKIPVGAGLGGGSSDAAAVLTALNNHFGKPLSLPALMALGSRMGADVPFLFWVRRRWQPGSATSSIPSPT
jgi:4-diphosphocytidyl-2-C-methyl-D-erythritol kinase